MLCSSHTAVLRNSLASCAGTTRFGRLERGRQSRRPVEQHAALPLWVNKFETTSRLTFHAENCWCISRWLTVWRLSVWNSGRAGALVCPRGRECARRQTARAHGTLPMVSCMCTDSTNGLTGMSEQARRNACTQRLLVVLASWTTTTTLESQARRLVLAHTSIDRSMATATNR